MLESKSEDLLDGFPLAEPGSGVSNGQDASQDAHPPVIAENEDLLYGAVPVPGIHVVPAEKKEFKPWHKPRKQWVRIEQWASFVRLLLRENRNLGDRTFRYLSLTGDDLLDVRVLQTVCKREKVPFEYCGFNDIANDPLRTAESDISEGELHDMDFIVPRSKVITDNIETVATSGSLALTEARSRGPFDAVNLDFCNDITHFDGRRFPRMDLIQRIMELQGNTIGRSWLLFITTRVVRNTLSTTIADAFDSAIQDNCQASNPFHRHLSLVLFDQRDAFPNIRSARNLTGAQFLRYYCIGFSKWLISMVASSNPQWNVRLADAAFYAIADQDPDVVSLVYKIERVYHSPTDRYRITGLIPVNPPVHRVSEADLALEALNELQGIRDVDSLLRNPEVFGRIDRQNRELLEKARYPMEHYNDFVNGDL